MFHSLLVHLDASPRSALRLALAHRLARQHGASLAVAYAVMPALLAGAWLAGEGVATAAGLLAEVDRDQRGRARDMFDREAAGDPQLRWVDIGSAPLETALAQQALFSDLLVLGQPDPDDARTGAVPDDLVPTLVMDSGRPALVVPSAGDFDAIGRRVLVAWKPTRESARALGTALPWLRCAAAVHLARSASGGDDGEAIALAGWLREHGVAVAPRFHALAGPDVGEALLSLAADVDADLLAMGCYGHSRTREFVLGGATRTVLRSMTLPVLMAH